MAESAYRGSVHHTQFGHRHSSKSKWILTDLDEFGLLQSKHDEAGEADIEELEDPIRLEKARLSLALEEGKVQTVKKRRKAGDALRDRDPWD